METKIRHLLDGLMQDLTYSFPYIEKTPQLDAETFFKLNTNIFLITQESYYSNIINFYHQQVFPLNLFLLSPHEFFENRNYRQSLTI